LVTSRTHWRQTAQAGLVANELVFGPSGASASQTDPDGVSIRTRTRGPDEPAGRLRNNVHFVSPGTHTGIRTNPKAVIQLRPN
jgi:hypothetical protein